MNYTTKDIRFIQSNLDLTDKELAEHLGRSHHGIKKLRERFGIIKKRWITEEEKQIVRDNLHLNNKVLAELIGRTPGATKALRNNL